MPLRCQPVWSSPRAGEVCSALPAAMRIWSVGRSTAGPVIPRRQRRTLTPRRALRLGQREGTDLCRSRHSGVNAEVFRLSQAWPGSWQPMAKIAGYAIPGIVWFFAWLVLIVLAVILLAWIVHW